MAAQKKAAGKRPGRKPSGSPPVLAGGASPAGSGPGPVVVGLGASAGGLQALIRFFKVMPPDSGMAFVVVQHLRPDHESLTAGLLEKHTAMGVSEVVDSPEARPNHVHVIPPDKHLSIDAGRLHLHEPPQKGKVRGPIDFFLRSLATAREERAAGIIFSGSGSDGALGLIEVKARGGMTIVQDPATAEHAGMPLAAIATGAVDHVLPIEEMSRRLIGYAEHPYVNGGTSPGTDLLGEVLAVLRARTKYDFGHYKKSMVLRRVQRRMGLIHVEHYTDYLDLLRTAPEEVNGLFKDLLIGVTGFFREPEAFKVLEREVIPRIVDGRQAESPLRVWVPGCATGEEAYSLAMTVLERLTRLGQHNRVQVFASDIDEAALEVGRTGLYPESIADAVSPDRLQRFFVHEDSSYRVLQELRDTVVFATHNLVSDPPFSRLDLISCRNVLIYLEPALQSRLLALFHFALDRDGYLFLGASEAVSSHPELFEPVSKKHRVYRRIGVTPRGAVEFLYRPREQGRLVPAPERERLPVGAADIGWLAQQMLLAEHTPAAVVIDHRGEVLYFHGDTDRFLAQPPGQPTVDLFRLARSDLASRVRGAVRRAAEGGEQAEQVTAIRSATSRWQVRITATPIRHPRGAEGLMLVTFREEPAQRELAGGDTQPSRDGGAVGDLERELKTTRQELQSTIQEMEAFSEELQASNEEMLSVNEELQSTNEELETAKEELQSLNEELTTVNNQLEAKLAELEATNNDLTNLLASTDVATVFLDTRLRIKRYSTAIARVFNLIPSDVGRPLSDIARKFTDDHLLADAQVVLETLALSEREVHLQGGHCFLRRVTPYRTLDNRTDGVVITFSDVSDLKRIQADLEAANRRLEGSVERRNAVLELLREVATVSNQAATVEEALEHVLPSLGSYAGWPCGQAWLASGEEAGTLVLQRVWCHREEDRFRAFREATVASHAVARGWLVDAVCARAQPSWTDDLEVALGIDRARALAGAGVRSVVGFPVRVGTEVVGAVEFLSEVPAERRELVKELVVDVGTELGRVVERTALQRRLAEVTLAEQLKLGQELHDGVAQEIAGIKMMAETLSSKLARRGAAETELAAGLQEAAEQAQSHVRALARGLVPVRVEAGGLEAALEELARRKNLEVGRDVVSVAHDCVLVEEAAIATALYYIAQEAVLNALRHGRPECVSISLRGDDRGLTLEVRDDGPGFDATKTTPTGSGLRIMAYRARLIAARLEVSSHPGGGTTVTSSVGGGWRVGDPVRGRR